METSSFFCLIFLFIYLSTKFLLQKSRRIPPSPLSLPIIGHLYLIKKPLHRSLAKIANKYGPILLLNFGSRRVLVISSPAAAEECFTKNDVVFANRPMMLAGKYLGYNYTTLTWASYGPHWRNIRRIFVTEILSTNRTQKLSSVRCDEVRLLIQRLFKGSCNGQYHVVDMKSAFFELTLNIVMKMISGKRYHGDNLDELEEIKNFRDMVVETFEVSGSTNMGDFMPVLKWFGLDGIERRLVALKEKRDGLVKILIEDHRRKRINSDTEQTSKTLLDVLLALQESEPGYYTDEIIGGIILVMLSAGTDTSSGTMEWALTLLLNNSECLKKARREIDNKIGESRLIQDSDLAELPYLNAIINETLRMKPAAPIIPAHESSEECDVGGFRVPHGTMLLVNAWAIQNNPKIWENPTKFNPERFLNVAGEKDGLKFLPFGLGRRQCPGESLAMRVVGLTLGSLIHCFEWERVDEKMIDMSEGVGMTISKAQPLLAKCIPRQNMVSLFYQL